MIKTVKFGKSEVKLDNNVGWAFIYKEQFGHDIISTLMPMIGSGAQLFSGIFSSLEGKEITLKNIAKALDPETISDAIIYISQLEFTEFINIVWALAKNADDDIPEPEKWVKQFEEFPVDIIAPEVIKLIGKGVTSSKNWKKLNSLKQTVQQTTENQSTSTTLYSPE